MLNCEEALGLLVRSIEGVVDRAGGERLTAHLEQCASCRNEAETQTQVRRVLAHRPDETLPDGFDARLSARLDAETASGWLEFANWRTWSIRLLPAAVALLIVAGIVEKSRRRPLADDPFTVSLLRGVPQGSVANLFERSDAIDDALMMELLWGQSSMPGKDRQR